jgi:hypothetical protein
MAQADGGFDDGGEGGQKGFVGLFVDYGGSSWSMGLAGPRRATHLARMNDYKQCTELDYDGEVLFLHCE